MGMGSGKGKGKGSGKGKGRDRGKGTGRVKGKGKGMCIVRKRRSRAGKHITGLRRLVVDMFRQKGRKVQRVSSPALVCLNNLVERQLDTIIKHMHEHMAHQGQKTAKASHAEMAWRLQAIDCDEMYTEGRAALHRAVATMAQSDAA